METSKVAELTDRARELLKSGHSEVSWLVSKQDFANAKQESYSLVRQAASISPNDKQILQLLQQLQLSQPILEQLKASPDKAGELLSNLKVDLSESEARECLDTLTGKGFEVLLSKSPNARKLLKFDDLSKIPDSTLQELASISIQTSDNRLQEIILQTLLSRLSQSPTLIKDVAKLLSINTTLAANISELQFKYILSLTDTRRDTRATATVAAAKYLEAKGDSAEKSLSDFITENATSNNENYQIQAFSAASALFVLTPKLLSQLLTTNGVIPLLSTVTGKSKASKSAILELLDSACVDAACGKAIAEHCHSWLEQMFNGKDEESASAAAVILSKLPLGETNDPETVDRLLQLYSSSNEATRFSAIEGIAFASRKPFTKDLLTRHSTFIKSLPKELNDTNDKRLIFGVVTTLTNITEYTPRLSEEKKRIAQLKDLSESKKPQDRDPLETDEAVTKRCKIVLDSGIVSALSSRTSYSPGTLSGVAKIIFSLSQNQKERGKIAQAGGVKLLMRIISSLQTDQTTKQISAQGLACLLISVNPELYFRNSSVPVQSVITALLDLLDSDSLLATFESLMALTNIASIDDTTRRQIFTSNWNRIEELFLSDNTLVRRAAVELLCNMVNLVDVIESFTGKKGVNRLHIALALADVEDLPTRLAASGALAILTMHPDVVLGIIERPRGFNVLLDTARDAVPDLQLRGLVCITNALQVPQPTMSLAVKAIKTAGAETKLKELVKRSSNPEINEMVLFVLQAIAQ
jgi:hypothetical protein